MHARSAFFTVHCTKEWYLSFTQAAATVHTSSVKKWLLLYTQVLYTGVIMPRIPAPPNKGWEKYEKYKYSMNST